MLTDRPTVVHAAALPDDALDAAPLDPAQVVAGNPDVRIRALGELGDLEVGIWQHGPGTSTDVELDEVFVVLSGRATVVTADGASLEVGPGDVVSYPAGTRTTWTVHEALRKVYVVRPQAADQP